jgi:opacity protein-like surface antigen
MSRITVAAFAAAVLTTTTALVPAMAQDRTAQGNDLKPGRYWGLSGGLLAPQDTDGPGADLKRDHGYTLSGQYGYRFPNNLRLEGELGYGNSEYDRYGGTSLGDDVDAYSLTGAVYYDLATGTALTPYAGLGTGLVHQRFDRQAVSGLSGNNGNSTDLTAFGEVGVGYKLASSWELVPSYRYQWINDGEQGLDDSTQHVLRVGLRNWF